jgi:hypothetical protein
LRGGGRGAIFVVDLPVKKLSGHPDDHVVKVAA